MIIRKSRSLCHFAAVVLYSISVGTAIGQGTLADYQRAHPLEEKTRHLVVDTPGPATWIGDTDYFWYPKTVKGGTEFVLEQADEGKKGPAFDQEKLAVAISKATGHTYRALNLPFAPIQRRPTSRPVIGALPKTAPLTFLEGIKVIQFGTDGSLYKCQLSDYTCTKAGPIPAPQQGRPGASFDEAQLSPEADLEGRGGDPVDGLEFQPPSPQDGDEGRFEHSQRPCAQRPVSQSSGGQARSQRLGVGSQFLGQLPPEPAEVCASFDGKWEAFIQNYNVFLKAVGGKEPAKPLSFDGSEGNYYTLRLWLLPITRAPAMTAK